MAHLNQTLWITMCVAMVVLLSTAGCTMLNLQRNISEIDRSIVLAGRVLVPPEESGNVFVLVYKQTPGGNAIVDYQQLNSDGYYLFLVAQGQQYYLTAFLDRNRNSRYEPGEPAGYYGLPTPISQSMEDSNNGATIELSTNIAYPAQFPLELNPDSILANTNIPLIFGEVITLDDPRLSREQADKSLWAPLDFARQNGIGIFFLEEYDPQKIPVLFVHGFGGTPLDWELFLKDLDRSRYQPWLFYYPTGVRLSKSERLMSAVLDHFKKKYGFSQLYMVAHSMGGLVARSYIINSICKNSPIQVNLLVTLSTPWNGHNAAARGVSNSPVVMPAWIDIQPDSGFIRALFEMDISSTLDYYLFFSFNNNKNSSGVDTDGTVTLTSQLDQRAQHEAKKMFGINASHRNILRDESVAESVNKILNTTTRQLATKKSTGYLGLGD